MQSTAENKAHHHTDVLIAGAGPTGMVMAAELARRGVSCRIIDIERDITDKSKAIGVQSRTLEILENMGIAHQFVARGHQTYTGNIYDNGKRIAHLSFRELGNKYPYLLMIPQSETEHILRDHLASLGINVERQTCLYTFTQDSNGVTAMVRHEDGNEETIRACWLIGCDGAHSTVRHILDMPFTGEEYEDGFQLADVKINWPLGHEDVYLSVHNGWLMAAFPLPGDRFRLIMDMPPEQAPTDVIPTLEDIQQRVNERAHVPMQLSDAAWTANYRIHRRIVTSLRVGRVFLGGDSAHIHSPAAAQGMNTGMQDMFNLAWKLALVIDGHSPASLLDSYHNERYPVEQQVLQTTDLMLKTISIKNTVGRAVRDAIASFASHLSPVQKVMRETISEINIHYKNSNIVEDHIAGGLHAGERLPDCTLLKLPENTAISFYDLLQTGRHLLLLLVPHTDDHTSLQLQAVTDVMFHYRHIPVTCCLVMSPGIQLSVKGHDTVLEDHEDIIKHVLGIKGPALCLVRPDGYIGFRAPLSADGEIFCNYLSNIFIKEH